MLQLVGERCLFSGQSCTKPIYLDLCSWRARKRVTLHKQIFVLAWNIFQSNSNLCTAV